MMNTHVRDNQIASFSSAMFANSTWNATIYTTGSTGPNKQTQSGDFVRVGPLVGAWGKTLMDGTTNFGGAGASYYLVPPKTVATYVGPGCPVGSGHYWDAGTNDFYLLSMEKEAASKIVFRWQNVGTTEVGLVNSTNPTVIADTDNFVFNLFYPTTST